MSWPDQHPPATDVILHVNVPCAGTGPSSPVYMEIDKLADGRYRATVGTVFKHQEICRTRPRNAGSRGPTRWPGAQSFSDVVNVFRMMRTLG